MLDLAGWTGRQRPCDGAPVLVEGLSWQHPIHQPDPFGLGRVEELVAWSRDRMAGLKVPRFVEFLAVSSVKVSLTKIDGTWLISSFDPV